MTSLPVKLSRCYYSMPVGGYTVTKTKYTETWVLKAHNKDRLLCGYEMHGDGDIMVQIFVDKALIHQQFKNRAETGIDFISNPEYLVAAGSKVTFKGKCLRRKDCGIRYIEPAVKDFIYE